MRAATAAADPAELAPGVCPASRGLRVGAAAKEANAEVCVFPSSTAPAWLNSSTTAASRSPFRPAYSGEPYSVAIPRVSKMSFTPNGTPLSNPPAAARRGETSTHARIAPSASRMRRRHNSSSSSAVF